MPLKTQPFPLTQTEMDPAPASDLRLACPDCRCLLEVAVQGYSCSHCNSLFERLEGNVVDLFPKWNKPGDEVIYRLPDFKAQFPYLPEIRRYFYEKRLARWSMSWSHKNTTHLIGREVRGTSIDLGVGCGDHYAYVAGGENLIGVDYDIHAMREARKNGVTAPLFRVDLTRMPFADRSFDTIRSTNTFEHLYYLEICLEEIFRTLKDDGMLVISFPVVGGFLMDLMSRLGPQKEFKRRYGLNWGKILKVEHCNTSRRILEAVRRIFVIEKIVWSPFGLPSHNLNMFITLKARKNPEFQETRS